MLWISWCFGQYLLLSDLYHNHASERKKELHVAGVVEGFVRNYFRFLG